MRLLIRPGQAHDFAGLPGFLVVLPFGVLIGDKAFRAVAMWCGKTDESFAAAIHLVADMVAATRMPTDPCLSWFN